MGEIARADEDMLYDMFGVDAELLIDHAWGVEPTLISDIKTYNPSSNSITSGQVLGRDYEHDEGRLIVKEMTDLLCLDLVARDCVTESITLHIGYANALKLPAAHGSTRLSFPTSSAKIIVEAVEVLYDRIKDKRYPMKRAFVYFNNIVPEGYEQYNMFVDSEELAREHSMQKAMIDIKSKFGKNAILKGMNLEKGGKTIERNSQIGGHRAGDE